MLIINERKKFFLKLETVYFAEDYETYESDADIVLFYLSKKPFPGARTFSTLRFDLTKSEEELYNDVSHTTRRRIHQALQSGEFTIINDNAPSYEKITDFCGNYDDFARTKGIAGIDKNMLLMVREKGSLCISTLYDKEGNNLCGTADIYDDKTVLGMYAYSHFRKFTDSTIRNKISNANRYLYWELIIYFKKMGFKIMDMGGLGMGHEGQELNSVDDFKLSFGGKVETLYHFYFPKGLLGSIIVRMVNKNRKIAY